VRNEGAQLSNYEERNKDTGRRALDDPAVGLKSQPAMAIDI
jgi:hypothetical protein